MKDLLLIFDMFDSGKKMIVIPGENLRPEVKERLMAMHDKYVGVEGDDELSETEYNWLESVMEAFKNRTIYDSITRDSNIKNTLAIDLNIGTVIVAGFIP